MFTHLPISILARECPGDSASFSIAALLPSSDFGSEQRAARQASVKTLSSKYADLDFCHVKPTGVLRGVVEDDAAEQLAGCLDAQHFLETDRKCVLRLSRTKWMRRALA